MAGCTSRDLEHVNAVFTASGMGQNQGSGASSVETRLEFCELMHNFPRYTAFGLSFKRSEKKSKPSENSRMAGSRAG